MFKKCEVLLKKLFNRPQLTPQAKKEVELDKLGLPENDPGPEKAIEESIAWLVRAQDNTSSTDDGVARDYSLNKGWNTSYPETTGYIIPTLIEYSHLKGDEEIRECAKRMLNWCVHIQLDDGAFQGGRIDARPVVPVTFNTGQILLGLAAGVAEFGEVYRPAMRTAADWLRDSQDDDGCWRKHPTPFAEPGEKAYETHVSWGLLEAARIDPDRKYGEAALKNVQWAITKQRDNGWFEDCCLSDPEHPLTHTIGYVLRGVIEAYRYSEDEVYLVSAQLTADAILKSVDGDGKLPGCLDSNWQASADWVCLTGSVQIAHCFFMLFQYTKNKKYRDVAYLLTRYVRKTIKIEGSDEVRGGIKGSFPVNGDYGSFEYLNWAAKFFIDANMLEREIRSQDTQS